MGIDAGVGPSRPILMANVIASPQYIFPMWMFAEGERLIREFGSKNQAKRRFPGTMYTHDHDLCIDVLNKTLEAQEAIYRASLHHRPAHRGVTLCITKNPLTLLTGPSTSTTHPWRDAVWAQFTAEDWRAEWEKRVVPNAEFQHWQVSVFKDKNAHGDGILTSRWSLHHPHQRKSPRL